MRKGYFFKLRLSTKLRFLFETFQREGCFRLRKPSSFCLHLFHLKLNEMETTFVFLRRIFSLSLMLDKQGVP